MNEGEKFFELRNFEALPLCVVKSYPWPELRRELMQFRNLLRPLTIVGLPQAEGGLKTFFVTCNDLSSTFRVFATEFSPGEKYESLTSEWRAWSNCEREFFEEFGITPLNHPWLKPLRYPFYRANPNARVADYPFFKLAGAAAHEVGVGPVHAGVIEPGHFRFSCKGEVVEHLECQLGYQHRGVEKLLTQGDLRSHNMLIASIAGDTTVANTYIYATLLESASSLVMDVRTQMLRTIGLELERAALHVSTLSGISGDVGYLSGCAFMQATRTYIINSLQQICGNRFGRGLIEPGGCRYDITPEIRQNLIKTLSMTLERIIKFRKSFLNSPSVLSRLQTTGVVGAELVGDLNLVGVASRASGCRRDIRINYPHGMYRTFHPDKRIMHDGDVYARTVIRLQESVDSLNFVLELLDILDDNEHVQPKRTPTPMPPEVFTLGVCEAPRGELAHVIITKSNGNAQVYKVKDPSFNNWMGLMMALRGENISDFPLCNKSFDLSYCGYDL